ncbi:secoisolariciresinol dehydrogenase-like [Phoenix dactylifera]|uniref:Secoisolariciresinol dehydrogenase-like n=1 Tax=Phoenix dactylifera TaxID=42345 RepID=A0A8B8ZJE6_PHODC|nr:secoisolariciresinol dehydrogenase-like [Phoenix dactylifera]
MGSAGVLSSVARRLEGKVALITGGASGIGKATAKLFARYGARVVIADVQDDKGHELCRDLGPNVVSYVHCDVTDESHVREAVDSTMSRHGKLDIMFNNAGIIGSPGMQILETDKANFEKVVGVNLVGCYLGTKQAARVMIPARQGSIVMTASVAGVIGALTPHAYTCSKHAVVGLMRGAAVELGQFGIRVNCVSPYLVATPLASKAFSRDEEKLEEFAEEHAVLKGKTLKAEDVAEAVAYLGSDEAGYVSGLNLPVDGAFTKTNTALGLHLYSDL